MIVRSTALALPLRDESVDLVVTSPPYFALRSYRDGDEPYDGQIGTEAATEAYVDALVASTVEMVRVLKPTGSIFVNLGDKYAAKSLLGLPWRYANAVTDRLGLLLRAEIVWAKSNGLPESVTDRVRRSHETWFHFTKQGRYFSTIDEIREPHLPDTFRARDTRKMSGGRNVSSARPGSAYAGPNPLGKTPTSVWTIATERLGIPDWARERYNLPDHFATFPSTWPARLIAGWSPPGGIVLDPFGGTGTVAMVARAMGRSAVSVDLSADYCRLAQWRVFESGGGEKAVAKARKNGLLRVAVVGQELLDFGGAA